MGGRDAMSGRGVPLSQRCGRKAPNEGSEGSGDTAVGSHCHEGRGAESGRGIPLGHRHGGLREAGDASDVAPSELRREQ